VYCSEFERIRHSGRPLLVTGTTGFKGTWLTQLLDFLDIPYRGISLHENSGSFLNNSNLHSSGKTKFFDLRDNTELQSFVNEIQPIGIIHLAAQPLVLEAYKNTLETFSNNVMSTVSLLEAVRNCETVKAIVVVTTDKVYSNKNEKTKFKESDPLGGIDPYSASKVATEAAVSAYRNLYKSSGDQKLISARAGNVIGGGDVGKNRLIPDAVRSHQSKSNMLVRNPESTRPWLHVMDPLVGYLEALEYLLGSNKSIEALNFGPNDQKEMSVLEVLQILKKEMEFNITIESEPESNSNYEAKYLDLDSSLSREILGWEQQINSEEAISRTAEWWKRLSNGENALDVTQNQISELLS